MLERWYLRPVSVLCALLACAALAVALGSRLELGQAKGGGREVFDVIVEHFGIDSEEIERSITRPLEAEFSRLDGVASLKSVSEYGKSRVSVELAEGADTGAGFVALSDAVERVYSDLPRSVQKPRIVSSSGGQAPAFVASLDSATLSLNELRDWVEREVKPGLEKQEGVGEVEVGGGELKEVHVSVDERRASELGLSFETIAQALQSQDALLPAGSLRGTDREMTLSVWGRLADLKAIEAARVPLPQGGTVALNTLAEVAYAGREVDTISRTNGEESVVLLVHAAGSANLIQFSRQMRAAMDDLFRNGITSEVILDEGKVLEDALWQTIRALLEGLAAVFLVLPLLLPRVRSVLSIAVVLPLSLAVTLAVLASFGLIVDRFVLAGFAVGFGAILDYAILVSRADVRGLKDLLPSLATGLGTTLLFLSPLAFLDFVWPGIRTLVLAVGLLLAVSFALTILFLPVLMGSGNQEIGALVRFRKGVARRLARPSMRMVALVIIWSTRHPKTVAGASLGVVGVAGLVLFLSGVELGTPVSATELSAHVEYESEASVASVDARMERLAAEVRALPGVQRVESVARQGSAEMTVGWDKKAVSRESLSEAVVEAGRAIPGAFVYIPEAGKERDVAVSVLISGDDNERLRALAKEAAQALSSSPGVSQIVLNFKDPPRRIGMKIDHAKAIQYGLSPAGIATALRWNLYGPVAVKWRDTRERDLRIMGQQNRRLTREQLVGLPLVGGASAVRLSSVAQLIDDQGGAKIYHENRQRVVYLTAHTNFGTAQKTTAALNTVFDTIDLPAGYAFAIDPRIFEAERNFGLVGAALGLSLLLIALLLAARSQSVGGSLLTLALVPVALAFPVLALPAIGGGYTVPILLGFVIIGGTIVNNAILTVDSASDLFRREGWRATRLGYRAVRRRLAPLLMTNLTAVLGALPLALAGEGGGLLPSLAFLVVWGALGASVTTLTTIPALLTLFSPGLKPLKPVLLLETNR